LEKAQNIVKKQLEIKATHDILDGKFWQNQMVETKKHLSPG
jgi:hypothetical protein